MKFPLPKPPAHKVITRKPAKKGGTQPPRVKPSIQAAQVAHWVAQFRQAFGVEHNYQKALECVLQAHALDPHSATVTCDVATSYLYLENYPKAIEYAHKSSLLDPDLINAYDVLSQAYATLNDAQNVKKYGVLALQLRDKKYAYPVEHLPTLDKMPPPPSPKTRENNIISFSLFGGLAKYCETAILNVQAAKGLYPDWTCRFYVDDSVPPAVVMRLQQAGSQVVPMGNAHKHPIPATLWRFLALDDGALHRVIFRDADSLVSEAEAAAVAAWVQSGKYFHVMRDWATHTELVLAGMWGAVVGTLTQAHPHAHAIETQILHYLKTASKHNLRFIDQFFLRDTQWSIIKNHMLQHDSKFGFLGAADFPITQREDSSHIGSNIANYPVTAAINFPDGCMVTWGLQNPDGSVLCQYEATIKDGKIVVYLPKALFLQIQNNTLTLKLF